MKPPVFIPPMVKVKSNKDLLFFEDKSYSDLLKLVSSIIFPQEIKTVALNINDPFYTTAFMLACWQQQIIVTIFTNQDYEKQVELFKIHKKIDLIINDESLISFIGVETKKNKISGDQIALLIPTSGSQNSQKIVALTLNNIFYSAAGTNEFYNILPTDKWWLSLPLNHIGGLMIPLRCIYSASSFSLKINHCNMVSFVPTQLYRSIQDLSLRRQLKLFKVIILGGAPTSTTLKQKIIKHKLPVSITFGMSESCSQLTATKVGDIASKSNNTGEALPYRKIEIHEKRIQISGDTVFRGYFQNGGFFDDKINNNCFLTEDLGKISNNQLIHLGRLGKIIKSGGENINYQIIEQVITNMDNILACKLIPIKDEQFGEVLTCFLQLEQDIPLASVQNKIQAKLRRFEKPKYFFEQNEVKINTIKIKNRHYEEFLKTKGLLC